MSKQRQVINPDQKEKKEDPSAPSIPPRASSRHSGVVLPRQVLQTRVSEPKPSKHNLDYSGESSSEEKELMDQFTPREKQEFADTMQGPPTFAKSSSSSYQYGRKNEGRRHPYFKEERTKRELVEIGTHSDAITLKVDRVPQFPHTDKTSQTNIFGERRDTKKAMGQIASKYHEEKSKPSDENHETYDDRLNDYCRELLEILKKTDSELTDYPDLQDKDEEEQIEIIKSNHARRPEWLHTIADCLGGPTVAWNLSAGTFAANTRMMTIEHAIKSQPGIGVEVTCYVAEGERMAEFYKYKVIAYNKDDEAIGDITFTIDAKSEWYNDEDYQFDKFIIDAFLERTEEDREDLDIPQFQLPYVSTLKIQGEMTDWDIHYPETGKKLFKSADEYSYTTDETQASDFNSHGTRYAVYAQTPISGDQPIADKNYPFLKLLAEYPRSDLQSLISHNLSTITKLLDKYDLLDSDSEARIFIDVLLENGGLACLKALGETIPDTWLMNIDSSDLDAQNKYDESLLHIAVQQGDLDLVLALIKKDVSLILHDCDGDTPLHVAAAYKDILDNGEIFEAIFLANKYLLKEKNNRGDTPLHVLAGNDESAIFEYLVSHITLDDMKSNNKYGQTILHIAAATNSISILDFASEHFKKNFKDLMKIKDNHGETPLQTAINEGNNAFVLKAIKIDKHLIFEKDSAGNTLLHLAIEKNNIELARAIYHSLDESEKMKFYTMKNEDGATPQSLAKEAGILDDIVKPLQQKTSTPSSSALHSFKPIASSGPPQPSHDSDDEMEESKSYSSRSFSSHS